MSVHTSHDTRDYDEMVDEREAALSAAHRPP